jgi:PEP-CTERM motif
MSPIFKAAMVLAASIVFTVCSVVPAKADSVTFTLGNNPQPNEENILLNTGMTATTVFGTTNQSNITVAFSSLTDILTEPANGQARVEALDGVLNNITITIPGGAFEDLIINPFFGSGTATVTATTVSNQSFSFSYTLSNGQNFLTIVATQGLLNSVTISAPGGFTDLRQPRISGAGLTQVPEPAAMVLLGTALVGLSIKLRRKTKR